MARRLVIYSPLQFLRASACSESIWLSAINNRPSLLQNKCSACGQGLYSLQLKSHFHSFTCRPQGDDWVFSNNLRPDLDMQDICNNVEQIAENIRHRKGDADVYEVVIIISPKYGIVETHNKFNISKTLHTCITLIAKLLRRIKINFGWTKKNLLERDLNLWPPDWCAGALPTELHVTSPFLAVSLFCQYLCSGGASQKSWNHILPFSPGSCPSYDPTLEEAVRGCSIKGYNFFFYKYHVMNHKGNWLGTF